MAETSGAGCVKSCAIGCASVVALGAVLAVGAWMGRDTLRQMGPFKKIADTVEAAKGEAVEMNALGARLAARYPAGAIPIRAHIQSQNGKTTRTIVVTFVDPEFPVPDAPAASEIARAIAAEHATIDRYDVLRLGFESRGEGTLVGSTATFEFPVASLRTPPADAR